jgi:hypothetical protein
VKRLALALAVVLTGSALASAQFGNQWGRQRQAPPRYPTADSFDGAFNFCRGMFTQVYREYGGTGWRTDYPDADINFSIRLSELTKTRVSQRADGVPNHLVLPLTDDLLFKCPYLHMEDVGTVRFTDAEVLRLREYLLKGGFLWVDDFWGSFAWQNWSTEIARVLPPPEYTIADITRDHVLYRTMFVIDKFPQIPSINHWGRTGGETSERGFDSAEVNVRGISDKRGRLMVLMTHNTDISDAWEREASDPRFFYLFSPNGYAVGINVLMYAMTH